MLLELDFNEWGQRYLYNIAMKFGMDVHGPGRKVANEPFFFFFGTAITSIFPVDKHFGP